MATRAFHIFKALLWILTCCALAQASPPPGARSACCEVVERVDQFVQTESSTREHGFAGEVARPEAEGRGAVEQSLVRSRGRAGGGTYWGRVGAASAGGALGGAITAAVPAAGLVAVLGIGGASTTATGLAERAIVSGGKDLGTARDIAIDAGVGMLTAGVVRGGSKVVQSLRAVKPAGVSASAPTASQSPRGGAAERAIVPFYPANSGFLGETTQTILTEGRVIDRVGGSANSRFFSPVGTPLAARALPPGTVGPLHSFEVVKPFSVEAGTVAPAFGQLGMGTQFRSAKTLGELTQQGFLRAVP